MNNKFNMKKFIAAILFGVMVLTLTACGNSEEAEEDGNVTLQFSIWSDEENYIRKVVDQYNAEDRGIQVELLVIPDADYDDKLKVMMSGDADMDIVDIRGLSQTATYASQGAILDLTDYIDNSSLDVEKYGSMWETSSYEGRYYALPTRSTCWVLYYNADLFDEAGIEYPGQLTWEEYGDLAAELKDKLGVYGGYWTPYVFQFAALQSGTYVDDEDTSMLKYSLELRNKWYNIDNSHMSYGDIVATNPDQFAEFESGNCVMMPNGEWCVNQFLQDEEAGTFDANWQVAPMPVPEGVEAGTTWGQFQFAAITSKSEHPEEAFDFLSYLCGPEGSEVYSECGMIHAYAGEESREAYIETTGKESTSVFFDAKKIQEDPNTPGYAEILTAFEDNAELYLLGEVDIDTCLQKFAEERDRIKEEYAQ